MTEKLTSDSFFHCTDGERAAFEAGIKLGGLFHQFVGTPVSLGNVESIEQGIRDAVRAQPFVKVVHVVIDRKMLMERCRRGEHGNRADTPTHNGTVDDRDGEGGAGERPEIGDNYTTLVGEMLDVRLSVAYLGKMAVCRLKFVRELNYPLMYIDRMEDICADENCAI